jgi:nicotinamide-nucleotide amidase
VLAAALVEAVARSRFVILTGGLGPTEDDVTVAAAAQALGTPLYEDQGLLARIKRCLKERGIPWQARFARMALIPKGATLLDPGGMICGFTLNQGGARLFFLPGVPRQMRLLFDTYVFPALVEWSGPGQYLAERTLRVFGLPEAVLESLVHRFHPTPPGMTVGYYPNFPETHLTMTLHGQDREALEAAMADYIATLSHRLGEALISVSDAALEELVGQTLRERRLTLAVAESCTGGLIGHRLTEVPGSSDYFLGGVVGYSNQAKIDLLGVSAQTLEQHGAVSPETAAAMATGARLAFGADVALATTGIAGPTGGTPQKPVGTVYIGLATPGGQEVWHHCFPGSRGEVKTLTAQMALFRLHRALSHDPRLSGH